MKMANVTLGIAAIWIVVLLLGIAGINVYHHLDLPKLNKYRIESHYVLNGTPMFLHSRYDIILEDTIYNQIYYDDVISTLQQAHKGDTVVFHLSGYGGDAQTEEFIADNIKNTKAHTVMSVEAPCYSAHAYLALVGNEIKMAPYSFLMLHFSTILNLDCSKQTGLDRGVSNVEHCNALKDNVVYVNTKELQEMPLLTNDERTKLYTGHDVYLQAETVNQRLHALEGK